MTNLFGGQLQRSYNVFTSDEAYLPTMSHSRKFMEKNTGLAYWKKGSCVLLAPPALRHSYFIGKRWRGPTALEIVGLRK